MFELQNFLVCFSKNERRKNSARFANYSNRQDLGLVLVFIHYMLTSENHVFNCVEQRNIYEVVQSRFLLQAYSTRHLLPSSCFFALSSKAPDCVDTAKKHCWCQMPTSVAKIGKVGPFWFHWPPQNHIIFRRKMNSESVALWLKRSLISVPNSKSSFHSADHWPRPIKIVAT